MPSTPSSIFSATTLTIFSQSAGFMFSLSIFITTSASMSAIKPTSGTASSISRALKAGFTAPVSYSIRLAIVPPVPSIVTLGLFPGVGFSSRRGITAGAPCLASSSKASLVLITSTTVFSSIFTPTLYPLSSLTTIMGRETML